jgi:hypothetical protein
MKKQSIVPSGHFGTGSDNIIVIDKFFSDELCNKIHKFLENNDVWNDSETSDPESFDFWSGKLSFEHTFVKEEFYKELKNKISELISYMEQTYDVVIKKTEIGLNFVRWLDGDDQAPHGDKENEDGSLQIGEIRDYDLSTIIYINDNFDGGNTYFTQHDISVKPKKGSVLIFPGDKYYIHGVSKVKNGTRYTLPKFWTVTEML